MALSTYNSWYFIPLEKQTLFIGETLSNVVTLKAPRSGNVSNNPIFSISKWISVFWAAASWKREGWLLHIALLCSFLSLHHLNARHVLVMAFPLSQIPKKETGASDKDEEAKRKKKKSYSKGNPVKSHFKRNSILGHTYTAFVAVWAARTVFSLWVLGTW